MSIGVVEIAVKLLRLTVKSEQARTFVGDAQRRYKARRSEHNAKLSDQPLAADPQERLVGWPLTDSKKLWK